MLVQFYYPNLLQWSRNGLFWEGNGVGFAYWCQEWVSGYLKCLQSKAGWNFSFPPALKGKFWFIKSNWRKKTAVVLFSIVTKVIVFFLMAWISELFFAWQYVNSRFFYFFYVAIKLVIIRIAWLHGLNTALLIILRPCQEAAIVMGSETLGNLY